MSMRQLILKTIGVLLIVVGVPLLVLPGPGLLLIAFGLGILFSQVRRRRADLSEKGRNGKS